MSRVNIGIKSIFAGIKGVGSTKVFTESLVEVSWTTRKYGGKRKQHNYKERI